MSVIKVAILGFGTVGEGFYRAVHSHADRLKTILGKQVEVAAVLIKNKQKKRNIHEDVLITTDFSDILNLPQLDVVVEAIVGKEIPFTFLKQSIEKGCHVITANKEMFSHYGKTLFELAADKKVSVGFEATVGGGIPVIQTLRQLLKVNQVVQIQGIINGTSNFILTEMREKKQSFEAALLQAQKNGYAEADPTNDVEGFDAFFKTMILSRIGFGEEPVWDEVEREGITTITSEYIDAAGKPGLRFKHIASLRREGGKISGFVKPALVSSSHPFYHVEGVQNAINIQSDIVGGITLQGPGAGMFPSASAVIEDLVYVCQNQLSDIPKTCNDAASDETEKSHLWFIHGKALDHINPNATLIEQVSEEFFIIEAEKKEMEYLAQEDTIRYFPILGEFNPTREVESVTVG